MTSKLIYESTIPLLGILFNGNFFTRDTGHVNTGNPLGIPSGKDAEAENIGTLHIMKQNQPIEQLEANQS